MDSATSRAHPLHAIAVYAESLATGARVAVFGDASVGLGQRLLDLGARAVHVWDPDERRARIEAQRAPRGVVVQPYSGDDPVRVVDLVVVADLGLFDDAKDLIARVRAMVGEDGVAIVTAANRELAAGDGVRTFDYYELFDLVAGEFQDARMVAQVPFHGVALVELGGEGEAPAVSVDTQLVDEARAPDAFVVLASQNDARLDAYAIVELPAPAPPPAAAEPAAPDLVALQRVAELTAKIDEMRGAAEAARAATAEVTVMVRRVEVAERHAAAIDKEVVCAGEAHASELARFEEALRERAQTVQTLKTELLRRERMVRDLAGELEDAAASPGLSVVDESGRLHERLDALALDVARREGEAHVATWTITELERRLAQATAPEVKPGPSVTDVTSKLRAALDELDVLRIALAREHAVRVEAERGEALVSARAEVERQAVLLDQMARELETRGHAGNSR